MSSRTVEIGGMVFCHPTGRPEKFKVYEVVESPSCDGCAFRGFFGKCKKPKGMFGECKADKRTDGKSVVFKKINQVKMVRAIR